MPCKHRMERKVERKKKKKKNLYKSSLKEWQNRTSVPPRSGKNSFKDATVYEELEAAAVRGRAGTSFRM